jgi:hypothetical protein
MPRKITFFKKSCTICTEDQDQIFFSKVVKKLSKSCQKSCQKVVKSCQIVAKKFTVHVVDNVGIHRAVPDVAAILRICAVQSAGIAKAPRPVCGVKALCPLPRQLCLLLEERDKLCHDLGMELAAGTILEEVLLLDCVKEGGVSVSGDDLLLA